METVCVLPDLLANVSKYFDDPDDLCSFRLVSKAFHESTPKEVLNVLDPESVKFQKYILRNGWSKVEWKNGHNHWCQFAFPPFDWVYCISLGYVRGMLDPKFSKFLLKPLKININMLVEEVRKQLKPPKKKQRETILRTRLYQLIQVDRLKSLKTCKILGDLTFLYRYLFPRDTEFEKQFVQHRDELDEEFRENMEVIHCMEEMKMEAMGLDFDPKTLISERPEPMFWNPEETDNESPILCAYI